MDCPNCEAQLIDYTSGELGDDERVAIARHLADCPTCAMEYCRIQADLDGIAQAHCETPRPEVFAALRKQVAAEVRPSMPTRAWRMLARPVPMYGVLLATLIPAGIWLVTANIPRPSAVMPKAPSLGAIATPTLIDYDATELPSSHRNVL